MRLNFTIAVALCMLLVSTSSAVRMSSSGVGEVIIVPYYTVQKGNSTLISVVNVSEDVKAVKIRFRESQNGKPVQSFNVYLPPSDVWTGKVENIGGKTMITTRDYSCTQPTIPKENGQGLPFYSDTYQSDGGEKSVERTKEGYVELFEMGVVIDTTIIDAVSFEHSADKPTNCSEVETYWSEGGVWRKNPDSGMGPISGGLMAQANVINVYDGVEYSETLTVLEGFSDSEYSLHSAPRALKPGLDSASPWISENPDDTWGKAVDAVSILLMSEYLFNEFTINDVVDASSEWIITFPTKYFYTDLTSNKQPFTSSFASKGACENVEMEYWNRETRYQPDLNSFDLCYVANAISFVKGALGTSNIFQAEWGAIDLELDEMEYKNGWIKFDFRELKDEASPTSFNVDDYINHIMESKQGYVYAGLPAIGFSASRLGNANVGKGAAYASTFEHKYTRSVARAKIDSACLVPGVCIDKSLDVDQNIHYDDDILGGKRHVYEFHVPKKPDSGKSQFFYSFSVVGHLGHAATVDIGVSKIKGRVKPAAGDDEKESCYVGPGVELTVRADTNGDWVTCRLDFDTDYYFTIANTEEEMGSYRFTFSGTTY